MSKRWLFSYALLTSSFLSFSLSAECIPSPDCADLGYDQTSCPSGDGVLKCPFDTSKLKCIPSNCKDTICAVGDIYYNDKTCSENLISGKTPIGVVGHITNRGKNGVVVALDTAYDEKENATIKWGNLTDLSLTNLGFTSALDDFSGKSNTQTILNECNTRPIAASYCNEYTKNGVSGWHLPAYGELYAILFPNFTSINNGLGKISSSSLIGSGQWYWSSSEYSDSHALILKSNCDSTICWDSNMKISGNFVRCVLAF